MKSKTNFIAAIMASSQSKPIVPDGTRMIKMSDEQKGFARITEVRKFAGGVGVSTLYAWMNKGEFPKNVKLGSGAVAWRWRDLHDWAESRPTAQLLRGPK